MKDILKEQQDLRWKSMSPEEQEITRQRYGHSVFGAYGNHALQAVSIEFLYGKHNLFNSIKEKMKRKLVVFTGSGISAESGIPTFRVSADGIWENYKVEEVCQEGCLEENPEKVHEFYNMLRNKYAQAKPNAAHKGLADLEDEWDVRIITQNVDSLHEQAGSTNVLHLHGEIMKCQAEDISNVVLDIPQDENGQYNTYPDKEIEGHLVRPYIVMFGEPVPNMEKAAEIVRQADVFVVVGTSLQVYPAASLLEYVQSGRPTYYVDPYAKLNPYHPNMVLIDTVATKGIERLKELLKQL